MASRRGLLLASLIGVGIVIAGFLAAIGLGIVRFGPTAAERQAAATAAARRRLIATESSDVRAAERLVAQTLPRATGAPAPSASAPLFDAPLRSHEVLGFVPYWTLGELTAADYADASTLAYFGPTLNANGTFAETDPDWNTSVFTSFVANAHADGDTVLVTVSTSAETTIANLLDAPATTARNLAAALAPVLSARGLSGVDLDVEGTASYERASYVRFVTDFASDLEVRSPGAALVVDTYVSAAGLRDGFFDVAALGAVADRLFVMGYDMEDPDFATPNAPLRAANLALSDVQALIEYTHLVPAAKLILGVPFYGYDYTTRRSVPGAADTATPDSVEYSSIAAAGHTARWDPSSLTPYALYSTAGQHHEIWFDDPVSIALKTALATHLHLAGVGAWAFGMEGENPAMLDALTGGSPPLRSPHAQR